MAELLGFDAERLETAFKCAKLRGRGDTRGCNDPVDWAGVLLRDAAKRMNLPPLSQAIARAHMHDFKPARKSDTPTEAQIDQADAVDRFHRQQDIEERLVAEPPPLNNQPWAAKQREAAKAAPPIVLTEQELIERRLLGIQDDMGDDAADKKEGLNVEFSR